MTDTLFDLLPSPITIAMPNILIRKKRI